MKNTNKITVNVFRGENTKGEKLGSVQMSRETFENAAELGGDSATDSMNMLLNQEQINKLKLQSRNFDAKADAWDIATGPAFLEDDQITLVAA